MLDFCRKCLQSFTRAGSSNGSTNHRISRWSSTLTHIHVFKSFSIFNCYFFPFAQNKSELKTKEEMKNSQMKWRDYKLRWSSSAHSCDSHRTYIRRRKKEKRIKECFSRARSENWCITIEQTNKKPIEWCLV